MNKRLGARRWTWGWRCWTSQRWHVGLVAAGLLLVGGAAASGQVRHVIHISVDGLRGDFIQSRVDDSPELYPTFRRLVDEGASTFNARTDFAHTVTLPNHTSMITGRPVAQPAGQTATAHHGYVNNDTPGPSATLHNSGNPGLSYVPSTFDVAHDNGLSTALFVSKPKFALFEQSYNAENGAVDETGEDNGRDKIDRYVFDEETVALTATLVADMGTDEFNYVFLHFGDPDFSGHDDGWGTAAWDRSVQKVDGLLGQLFEAIETDPGLVGETAIIVTADHGGMDDEHGEAAEVENYTIPVFVWGTSVAAGGDLYELNLATHLDPGDGRPDFNARLQPIRNGGTGNLALRLLGLGAIDGSQISIPNVGESPSPSAE